ncbi:hypothetical protein HPB49_020661 [Dermacentor silvarum]|uniref:Uncharacterized protein n=1 Tax=Dermacentor silvarum TaxID=543639 RepID=A0ACB8DFK6_DERSI|nr:uncharacterized protein LOC119440177 [Dermacentor silvarum]KAH7966919.1 hypothetical protein HPB49_020661 [Dermacentor silvarum]
MPPPTQQLKDVAAASAFKPPAGANAALRQAVPVPQAVPQVVPAGPTTAVEQPRPAVAKNAPPLQDIKPANPKAVLSGAPQGGEQDEVVAKHSTRRTSTFRSTFRDATEAATPEWDAEISPPLPGSEERKRRRGVRRPADLPLLHLPKFMLMWAPMKIIGLLRPQPTRARRAPTLRELLHEVQNREQEALNRYTKERQRQITVVLVIAVLFLYFIGVVGAYFYYELTEQTPAVPGNRRVPLRLLRSTINGSATSTPEGAKLRSLKRAAREVFRNRPI